MYVEDYKRKLRKNIVRIGNTDYIPISKVDDILDNISNVAIAWSEEDFESQAIQNTNETDWREYYNEKMFGIALERMIRKHDASIGITWDTIDYYLDEYCKIKDYIEIIPK